MTTAPKKKAKPAETADLPAAGDLESLAARVRLFAEDTRHARALGFLRSLSPAPPQVLLLEGGTGPERADAALYWALLLNCESVRRAAERGRTDAAQPSLFGAAPAPQPAESGSRPAVEPCFSCPACLQFLARMHRDLIFLDGSEGGISIDSVREVRAAIGEAPREAYRRVVILAEAQALSEAAANAMLKSLEDVQQTTVFVLTAPQRERLLPTLVSRSWVLTLAWPDPLEGDTAVSGRDAEGWASAAAIFLQTGKGLFERTGARGVDAAAVSSLMLACQRGLTLALAGETPPANLPGGSTMTHLVRFFAALPDTRQAIAANVLAEGQDSLVNQVNPGLVADWVMTRLYLLNPR